MGTEASSITILVRDYGPMSKSKSDMPDAVLRRAASILSESLRDHPIYADWNEPTSIRFIGQSEGSRVTLLDVLIWGVLQLAKESGCLLTATIEDGDEESFHSVGLLVGPAWENAIWSDELEKVSQGFDDLREERHRERDASRVNNPAQKWRETVAKDSVVISVATSLDHRRLGLAGSILNHITDISSEAGRNVCLECEPDKEGYYKSRRFGSVLHRGKYIDSCFDGGEYPHVVLRHISSRANERDSSGRSLTSRMTDAFRRRVGMI